MTCQVFLDCPDEFRPAATYTLAQLLTILGISHGFIHSIDDYQEGNLLLLYVQRSPERYARQLRSSAPFLIIPFSAEPINLSQELLKNPPENSFPQTSRSLEFDLVRICFSLLSREEEMENPKRDVHNRFPLTQSVLYSSRLLRRPLVNQYLIRLLNHIRGLVRNSGSFLLRKDFWPPGHRFAVCLSHDIDFKRKWGFRKLFLEGKTALGSSSRLRTLKEMSGSLTNAARKNAYWNLRELTEMEKERGFRSSFLFSSARTARRDPTYTLTEPRVETALRELTSEGFEIAMHGSYLSYTTPGQVQVEKSRLERATGKEVLGNRFHYLRFEVDRSWKVEEEAGLGYDMTLGYPDEIGFRAGVAFPYHPYDFERRRGMQILELPLTVSDGALLSAEPENPGGALLDLLSRVRDSFGLACILWHPHTLDKEDFPELNGVYPSALDWMSENRSFAAPGKEIANWWLGRKGLTVTTEGANCHVLRSESNLESVGIELIGPNSLRRVDLQGLELVSSKSVESGYYAELRGVSRGEEAVLSLVG